jgi:hypothetical protein
MTRRSVRAWAAIVIAVACGVFASDARAQQNTLPDRLSPSARATIERLLDSARASGLPTSPLVDKTAEGVLKGADDDRIVRAVQVLARELGQARTAVGGTADLAVLGAAASALHAGVSPTELHALAFPSAGAPDPGALSSALVTLVDLVAKRVPVATATRSIRDLLERRAGEHDFVALRSEVEQDILAGRSPEASLTARVRGVTRP